MPWEYRSFLCLLPGRAGEVVYRFDGAALDVCKVEGEGLAVAGDGDRGALDTLEVSSPGMARPLRKAHDFERFAGETVVLQTTGYEGRRKFTGTLEGIEGTAVTVTCDGEALSFDLADIRSCTIKP
ncbi:MAG: hypothetical protein IJI15_08960, partial [Atopobiaceae bacterium]|nr:hypothetical protein [Atopobiaceae bacterium]